jgi:hypothetical protein
MPIKSCEYDGKQGFKWGNQGKCYTYEAGDDKGRERARNKARDQGIAIGEYFREVLDRLNKIKRKLYKKK